MASEKVEICHKKKNHPEQKYSVTFVTKVGTIIVLYCIFNQTQIVSSLEKCIGIFMIGVDFLFSLVSSFYSSDGIF